MTYTYIYNSGDELKRHVVRKHPSEEQADDGKNPAQGGPSLEQSADQE